MSSWTKAVPCEDVRNRPVVFKVPPKQVALFYAGEAFYAVDNRCPHEGYPLSEGNIDDGCLGLDRGIGHFALMRPKKMSSEPR